MNTIHPDSIGIHAITHEPEPFTIGINGHTKGIIGGQCKTELATTSWVAVFHNGEVDAVVTSDYSLFATQTAAPTLQMSIRSLLQSVLREETAHIQAESMEADDQAFLKRRMEDLRFRTRVTASGTFVAFEHALLSTPLAHFNGVLTRTKRQNEAQEHR